MARDLWTHDEMILVTYIKKMKISSLISISKLGLDNPFPFATSQFTPFSISSSYKPCIHRHCMRK